MATFITKHSEMTLTMKETLSYKDRGKVITENGKHIRFRKGVYDTNDKEEIKFLKSHREFNVSIFEAGKSIVEAKEENKVDDSLKKIQELRRQIAEEENAIK